MKYWQCSLGLLLVLPTFLHPKAIRSEIFSTPESYSPRADLLAASPSSAVAATAKSVTVMIGDDFSNGSGIIIQRDGNRYTVLTAAHVVESPHINYRVTTSDTQSHAVQATEIKRLSNLDMATVTFRSDRTYPVAQIASAQSIAEGTPIYVTGFPRPTAAITNPVYNFTDGKLTALSSQAFRDGYAMVYTNRTLPGMSGGGVFDSRGNLVGIHGRGDVDSSLESSSINSDIRVKTGFNLGIPVDTFVSRASEVGVILEINLPAPKPANPVNDLVVSATVKAQQSDYNGAIADISRAIQRSPKEARLYMARANYYTIIGRQDQAVEDLNQAIKYDPTQEQAYWQRGSYRQANRDQFGALEDFTQVIKLNPDNSRAYLMRATIYVTQTDYASAIADYSEMIRIDPRNAMAYSQRAGMKFIQGDAKGAIADYSKLIDLNPRDVDAYSQRAHVRLYSGDPQGALADYRAITKITPRSQRAWEAIADIAKNQNNIDGAIDAYGEVIAINPRDTSIYAQRGELYASQKKYRQAIAQYSKIVELKPHEEYGYILRGFAREESGDRAGAKADFLKLAEITRRNGDLEETEVWEKRASQL